MHPRGIPLRQPRRPGPLTPAPRDGPRGYTIVEDWYRDRNGQIRCDCIIDNPDCSFHRRCAKLSDALEYLRAHLQMARVRAESIAAREGER